eukprot:3937548-Rhodomonas_salina.2
MPLGTTRSDEHRAEKKSAEHCVVRLTCIQRVAISPPCSFVCVRLQWGPNNAENDAGKQSEYRYRYRLSPCIACRQVRPRTQPLLHPPP